MAYSFDTALHCVPKKDYTKLIACQVSGRKRKRKCNMHWFLNTHPISIHLAYLLTCCFNFRLPLNILCKQQTILSKHVLWTKAAFSACLAWHWPDHHWQRVAWTYLCMSAGKRRTLWETILTIFSHMTEDVSVFIARYWYSKSVRLSVCLSVTSRYCMKTA